MRLSEGCYFFVQIKNLNINIKDILLGLCKSASSAFVNLKHKINQWNSFFVKSHEKWKLN